MDFVILKVNGQDVSNSSHEDAVRCFQSAQEPIIVEVLRRQPGQTIGAISSSNATTRNENEKNAEEMTVVRRSMTGNSQGSTMTTTATGTTTSVETNDERSVSNMTTTTTTTTTTTNNENSSWKRNSVSNNSTFSSVSTGVQTDWAGLVDEDELLPVALNPEERTNDSFEDFLTHDMDFEEVTLRKTGSAEKLGLTVCYSSGSGSEDADTEVYISEIIPESVAARDGRLREGDQILRVNGKDVANKEQTENLFAETNNAVTILVSRYLYQEDDYDDRRLYIQGSPSVSPDNIPAYQNSMIEQLIRQQQQQPQLHQHVEANNKENDGNISGVRAAPPVPCHTAQHPTSASTVVPALNSSSTCSSQNSQKSGKSATSPAHQSDERKQQWIQEALSECTKRIDNVSIRGQSNTIVPINNTSSVKLVEAYSSHVWSDTEHIYETIPESDNEPIYSSPYEHRQRHWTQTNREQIAKQAEQTANHGGKANWHSSSKSNSSGEEKDSSSAYNTGESCHSNPLTLELHQVEKDHHKSTLVLCTPTANAPAMVQKVACSCPIPVAPLTKQQTSKTSQTAKKSSSHHQHRERDVTSNVVGNATLPADTMYTNVANLEQTMILQQQLFKQALNRKNYTTRDTGGTRKSKSHGNFQAPNLTQYQFVGSQQVCATSNSWNVPEDKNDVQMEWKVKRRPDGSRYITRRPVRSRVLRNRAIKISEERAGHTTEDDTMSEMKVGRYWTKEERKRQLERARERKQRQQELLIQQQFFLQQNINDPLISDHIEEKSPKKPLNIVELSYKKMARKKTALDDFTTVQEMLAHGNRVGGTGGPGAGGKHMGLLSVTTV